MEFSFTKLNIEWKSIQICQTFASSSHATDNIVFLESRVARENFISIYFPQGITPIFGCPAVIRVPCIASSVQSGEIFVEFSPLAFGRASQLKNCP